MNIRRVSCKLTFWSRDLTTSQMSTIAGLRPDASAERNMASWGATVERDSAFWELRSRTETEAHLGVHINDLFARVLESWDGLVALRNRVDDCQLQIAVHSNPTLGDTLGIHIGLDQVAILAALRAEADFEVYIED
jgi:Domain of unknown function (DUF4279)